MKPDQSALGARLSSVAGVAWPPLLAGNVLDFSFKLQFTYFQEQVPWSPGGKFEEFAGKLV